MAKGIASEEYRTRVRPKFEYQINTIPLLRAAFPLYYDWYMRPERRGTRLPKGWIVKNFSRLDRDFIQFDMSGKAAAWLDHFATQRRKAQWYKDRFEILRQLLKDGVVFQTKVSAPKGEATYKDPERNSEVQARKMEDDDFAMAEAIRKADASQRQKNEIEEERADKLASYVHYSTEDLFTRFPDLVDLANYLIRQRTQFEPGNVPFCTNVLPFGAKTIYEAIRIGLSQHKHFHFHYNTTTRSLTEEEWHGYLTGGCRNPIFSYADREAGSPLARTDIVLTEEFDLKFLPVFSYMGTEENGQDRILLSLETHCQTPFHKKAPVGTVGFRYNKAGIPANFDGRRVCTLMFVWSERKFLESVEAGTLNINRTLPHGNPMFDGFNMDVWDPNSWKPVQLH